MKLKFRTRVRLEAVLLQSNYLFFKYVQNTLRCAARVVIGEGLLALAQKDDRLTARGFREFAFANSPKKFRSTEDKDAYLREIEEIAERIEAESRPPFSLDESPPLIFRD